MRHEDRVQSTCAENDPLLPNFFHLDVLGIWHHSVPESEKSQWTHTGCKFTELSGLQETQDVCLVLPGSLEKPVFHSFTHHGAVKITQIMNKYL